MFPPEAQESSRTGCLPKLRGQHGTVSTGLGFAGSPGFNLGCAFGSLDTLNSQFMGKLSH